MACAHQQKELVPAKCQLWGQGLLDRPGEKEAGGSLMREHSQAAGQELVTEHENLLEEWPHVHSETKTV